MGILALSQGCSYSQLQQTVTRQEWLAQCDQIFQFPREAGHPGVFLFCFVLFNEKKYFFLFFSHAVWHMRS